MKQVISLAGGAFVVSEQGGDFFLTLDGELGGGELKGIVSGKASIKLGSGTVALKVLEGYVNHLLPASWQPVAQAFESILNAAIAQA